MESSLKDEIDADGSLLNHARAEPLSVMEKVSMQLHLILVGFEVVYGVFPSVKIFDLRHSELCHEKEE